MDLHSLVVVMTATGAHDPRRTVKVKEDIYSPRNDPQIDDVYKCKLGALGF